MLKSVDVNKENTIAQFKEEVGRLQVCLTDKEKQYREILAKVSPMVKQMRTKVFLLSRVYNSINTWIMIS